MPDPIRAIARYLRRRREERCRRMGHDARTEQRRGYREAKGRDAILWVAFSIREERTVCWRCGAILSDWTEVKRSGLTGLSLNADMMDELEEKGVVYA